MTTVVDPDALDAPLSLVEAAPDAMFVVDADGLIVFANGRAGQLFGTTVTDLLGRPIEDLLPDDVRAAHRHHRVGFDRDARTREMGSGLELHARRFDGGVFPAEVSFRIFFAQAIIVFFITLVLALLPLWKVRKIKPVKAMHG